MVPVTDLFELTGLPWVGAKLGIAGTKPDVEVNPVEQTATVYEDGELTAASSGGFNTFGAHDDFLYGGSFHYNSANYQVTYDHGGVSHTGFLIVGVPLTPGPTKYFFLPEDEVDPLVFTKITITSMTSVSNAGLATISNDNDVSWITCFLAGTRIATPRGLIPVEYLMAGDLVETLDHGPQPLIWAGGRMISSQHIAETESLWPVRIAKGALGCGLPERDLFVSLQHRLLVQGPIAKRMFGQDQILVPARQLIWCPGIELQQPNGPISYHHLLFVRHEIVLSEGAPSESLLLADQSESILGPEVWREIEAVLPPGDDLDNSHTPARLLAGKRGHRLVYRHRKNAVPLLSGDILALPEAVCPAA